MSGVDGTTKNPLSIRFIVWFSFFHFHVSEFDFYKFLILFELFDISFQKIHYLATHIFRGLVKGKVRRIICVLEEKYVKCHLESSGIDLNAIQTL